MADKNRIEVQILGQKYTIRTDASAEYVRDLADHVERRAREIQGPGPVQDPVKVLALTALHIADELARVRQEQAVVDQATGDRLSALSQILDSVATPRGPVESP